MKHFRATHKETGEHIEFGIEDMICTTFGYVGIRGSGTFLVDYFSTEDYDLEYNHKGEWFSYE